MASSSLYPLFNEFINIRRRNYQQAAKLNQGIKQRSKKSAELKNLRPDYELKLLNGPS